MGRGSCADEQRQSLKRKGNAAVWLRQRGIFFPLLRLFFSRKDLRRSAAVTGICLLVRYGLLTFLRYSENLSFAATFPGTKQKHMWVARQFVLRESRLDPHFELDSGRGIDRNCRPIS